MARRGSGNRERAGSNPPVAQALKLAQAVRAAAASHARGNLAEAERLYQAVLGADGANFDALHLLGVLRAQQGRHEEGTDLIERALRRYPGSAEAHNNLGTTLHALKRHDQAIACYRRAIAIKPDYAAAHNNLGISLQELDRHEEAIATCQRALAIDPDYADANFNLANSLRALARRDQAVAGYRKAIAIRPDYFEAHSNLGGLLAEAHRYEEALASYRCALAIKPDHYEAHLNLGTVFQAQGLKDQALACCRKALSLNPACVEARWAIAMYQLPPVFEAGESVEEARAAFSRELGELSAWFDADRVQHGFRAVGTAQPFLLAYQEEPNRALLARYGDLCARLMRHWQDAHGLLPGSRAATGTIRVGIISAHVRDHSVWQAIVKGWVRHLDRGRFELHLFHLDAEQDQETAVAKAQASYLGLGGQGLQNCVEAILERRPDVLIYPEIGMHSMTAKLASLRLAPVQVASWGHPETTGLPTIDYYLSAEDLEPAGAQQNYSEQLVVLPHLGCAYQPMAVDAAAPDLAALGVNANSPLLLCPGTPFKYAPRHDWVFPEIAGKLGRCQFVFFTRHADGLSDKLRQRLETVFARAGLDFRQYGVFIPWQKAPAFHGLLERADVYLDTIGFSGFNTAMQAVERSIPIVTREGRYMRGRLASGILKRIGLPDLVAASEQDYVALAVRLAQDAGFRQHVRERMRASRQVLLDDMAPIRAIEDFLSSAAGRR